MTSIITRVETTSRCGHETRNGRCGIPRASHRGTGHKYEAAFGDELDYVALALCAKPSCGMEAVKLEGLYIAANAPLTEAGWRIIGGEWHCPQCVTKFDRRVAKKRDPRQASFMEES